MIAGHAAFRQTLHYIFFIIESLLENVTGKCMASFVKSFFFKVKKKLLKKY